MVFILMGGTMSVISFEVRPKKDKKGIREAGAFMVKIVWVNHSITMKWFRGEKTRPIKYINLPKEDYRKACELIDECHKSMNKVEWHRGSFKKCAYAHQKKSEAAGAC